MAHDKVLEIARNILSDVGGTLWHESSAGIGTTFHVAVPASPLTEQER